MATEFNDGASWWVLRLNDFPEHPLFTLFVDARVVGDIDDLPPTWGIGPRDTMTATSEADRAEILLLMAGLARYGSDVGQECPGDWCTCDILTDEYAARTDLS